MSAPTSTSAAANGHLAGRSVFSRVVAGVDGSSDALEAVRQAARLRSTEAGLALLSAWELRPPVVAAIGVPAYGRDEHGPPRRAQAALREARQQLELDTAQSTVVRGLAWKALIEEVERRHHTLIAVGSHHRGRMSGIVAGSTATQLLHKAPCSVLVARPAGPPFPSRIVVGVDGSQECALAYAAAAYLADRFGAELHPIAARGRPIAVPSVSEYELSADDPVAALVGAAADTDLVVVGSRGLHGLWALASVSERVAHEAPCSVLVVRYRKPS